MSALAPLWDRADTGTWSVQEDVGDELLGFVCGGAVSDAHREFVAAESGQYGIGGRKFSPAICTADQMFVAGKMALSVVERFEVVDVEHNDGDGGRCRTGSG